MFGHVGRILVPRHDHETCFVLVEGSEQIISLPDHPPDQEGGLLQGKVRDPFRAEYGKITNRYAFLMGVRQSEVLAYFFGNRGNLELALLG